MRAITASTNKEIAKIWRGMKFDKQAMKLNRMAAYGGILLNTINNGANQMAISSGACSINPAMRADSRLPDALITSVSSLVLVPSIT